MSRDLSTLEAAQRVLAVAQAARGQLMQLAHGRLDFAQVVRIQQIANGHGEPVDMQVAIARSRATARTSPSEGAAVAADSEAGEADDKEAEPEADSEGGADAEADADPADVPGADVPEAGIAVATEAVATETDEVEESPPVVDEVLETVPDEDEVLEAAPDEDEVLEAAPDEDEVLEAAPDEDEVAEDDAVAVPEDPEEEVVASEAPAPADDDAPIPVDPPSGDEEATVMMSRSAEEEATVLLDQSDAEVAAALAALQAQSGATPDALEQSTIPAAFLGGEGKSPNLAEEATRAGDDEATIIPRAFLDPQIKETDVVAHSSAAVRIFGTKGQAVEQKGVKHRPIPMEEAPARYHKGVRTDELGLIKEEAEYKGPTGPSITAQEDLPEPNPDTSLESNPDALPRADISAEQLEELTAAAEEAIQKGNLSVAADRWTDLLDLVPDHVAAYIGRGRCYLELGDYAAAMSDFQKAEDLDKADVEPVVAMGDLYFARKEYQRAIECFDNALEREASHAMARCRRGISHYQRKNYRQAFLDLQRAYNLDPNIPNIRKYVQMAIKKLEREGKRR